MKLLDLLQKGESLLTATSTFLSQKAIALDCTGVDYLTLNQLNALLSAIPEDWDFSQLAEVFEASTLSETFAQQLSQWSKRGNEESKNEQIPSVTIIQSPTTVLDIFNLRDEIINDYRSYIKSFLTIREKRVREFVNQELEKGELWPDPLVQINPSYKRGSDVIELAKKGVLHTDCRYYFSRNGKPFQFYHHQEQAFLAANKQEPYVLTTGTGSGKSLSYVVPIVDDLLRHPEIKGVRAILVYPMNALINSQKEEFDKFLKQVPNTHIRVEQYTGQESLTKKTEIQNNPPQILLTNYVMLELMLTRTHENQLVASSDLKFLILDELHTYRGRQGADVAILIRKLHQRCGKNLLCIGTSATMSTEGTRENRRQTVAGVASKLFGVEVKAENVIDETLERSITRPYPQITELQNSLESELPTEDKKTLETFKQHPLSAWIEMNFGLKEEGGHLVRRTPISLQAGATRLAEETEGSVDRCLEALKQVFLWGSKTKGLAFRLHQFISQGGSVYATLEPSSERFLTLEGQYSTTKDRLLYPLVFCRECGHDYYLVRYDNHNSTVTPLIPNRLESEIDGDEVQEGYLTLDETDLWQAGDEDRLPDNWFKETKKRGRVAKEEYLRFIPKKLYVYPNGQVAIGAIAPTAVSCWFIPKPFLTCLHCGIVYDKKKHEFTKLSRLSSEGRSTATTLLCLSTVSRLKTTDAVTPEASKILSFTDNRQDASLQAGHFNDFVQTSFLRASLNGALQSQRQLTHKDLAIEVVKQMGLSQADYAKQPAEFGAGKKRNEGAFQSLIEYRLYEDLRRGWRIVQPNLEQCGLLEIDYEELQETCSQTERWEKYPNPILLQASPTQRYIAAKALLDQLRKELVIDAQILQPDYIEKFKREVEQALNDIWKIEKDEYIYQAGWADLVSGNRDSRAKVKIKLTSNSNIGRFLRSPRAWNWLNFPLSVSECDRLIAALVNILLNSGFLVKDKQDMRVQLRSDCIIWRFKKVDKIAADLLTTKRLQGSEQTEVNVNKFFQDFYTRNAQTIQNFEGREHTGQVTNQKRQEREDKFRAGQLEALFCSPTMELGIDISDLSVVHLRNVPPTPANYAQRSGRAGRGGQQALVITYASNGSGHDQYFFKRQEQMVAGVVVPPKLELANPDLIQSHIYSIWLAYTGVDLGNSMNEILDLSREGCPLKDSLKDQLTLSPPSLKQCLHAAETILGDRFCQKDLERRAWYSSDWIKYTLENALSAFDRASDRWRRLYNDAVSQLEEARQIIDSSTKGSVTKEERVKAESLEREAKRQIDLLVGQSQSDRNRSEFEFYPYRYFAAEGFLPGFNFPRLPVRAYIPLGNGGEFISRPRIVAIREVAPSNIVYYEGSKFQITKTRVSTSGDNFHRFAVCFSCGYFHHGDDVNRDTCENCGAKIADAQGNTAKLNQALTMDTMFTRRRERITCDEEERLKYGYNITTHFRYDSQKKESATALTSDNTELLRLAYGETASILRINRGLKRSKEGKGFKLDANTGLWGNGTSDNPSDNLKTEVYLTVQDTCNILLIEPANIPSDNSEAFLATLQYALEQAIQAVYKLEEDELATERLGQGKYILFWEAAEGGAGVLSQILENPRAFKEIANAALDICHFHLEKESCTNACYECLLSYRNQFDHPLINRHLVRSWLEQLGTTTVSRHFDGSSRQKQYETLRAKTDPNSELERQVLKAIYERGLRLPDAAQEFVEQGNLKPDFLYKGTKKKVAIFCDGSVHDHPEKRDKDKIERDNLKYDTGYFVLVFRYDEDWGSQLELLASWI